MGPFIFTIVKLKKRPTITWSASYSLGSYPLTWVLVDKVQNKILSSTSHGSVRFPYFYQTMPRYNEIAKCIGHDLDVIAENQIK